MFIIFSIFLIFIIAFSVYLTFASEKQKEEKQKEDFRRRNCYVYFSNGITENDFQTIAIKSISKIKKRKIGVSIDKAIVYGKVLSQTGLSSWNFSIDFNDYGLITGKYWILSENEDSSIPISIANNMKEMIEELLKNKSKPF